MSDAVKPCCREAGNLSAAVAPDAERPEMTVQVCRVCGCRHFRLDAVAAGLTLARV